MKSFLAVMVLALFSGVTPVLAKSTGVEEVSEERVEHYEGRDIRTVQEALEVLQKSNEKIGAILEAEELGALELESIHEISYTLETAIDKLIAEKAGAPGKLEAIDESVQAVHYASENHEETKVREWFAKLENAFATLDDSPAQKAQNDEANEKGLYEIVIKDHVFTPAELHVPAGKKLKLVVHNQDATPEEFESDDFRREKIIAGNSSATIFVGPLKPGKYHFFGEFNLDTANGYLIAQ